MARHAAECRHRWKGATIIKPSRLSLVLALFLAAPASVATGGDEILWDSFGVPHVYAATEAGMFRGFGYAQAQSHGDLLLHLYGEARARAAEYWGARFEAQDRWLIAN